MKDKTPLANLWARRIQEVYKNKSGKHVYRKISQLRVRSSSKKICKSSPGGPYPDIELTDRFRVLAAAFPSTAEGVSRARAAGGSHGSAPAAPPGGSVRGERANLTGLVLSCIEAKFCK